MKRDGYKSSKIVGNVKFVFPENLSWNCVRCGTCCEDMPGDIDTKEKSRINREGYKDYYEAEIPGSNIRMIKRKSDGSCYFYDDKGCKIHNIKPTTCRIMPFAPCGYDNKMNKIVACIPKHIQEICEGVSKKSKVDMELLKHSAPAIEKTYKYMLKSEAKAHNLNWKSKIVKDRINKKLSGMFYE